MSDTPPPASDSQPTRPAFRFKTPSFPVDNPPSGTPSPHGPTDVREHFRHAEAIRTAAAANKPAAPAENEVHDILRANVAHADAAGLNKVKPVGKRPKRRLRDYLIIAAAFNGPVITLIVNFRQDWIVLTGLLAGFVLFNSWFAWTMFVVLDKY